MPSSSSSNPRRKAGSLPLLVVGATTGSLLHRAGPWAETVRQLFGVAMLAVAIYLLAPVLPLVAQQLLWAALLIVAAMFAHAIDPLPQDAPGHRRLVKGVGVIGRGCSPRAAAT